MSENWSVCIDKIGHCAEPETDGHYSFCIEYKHFLMYVDFVKKELTYLLDDSKTNYPFIDPRYGSEELVYVCDIKEEPKYCVPKILVMNDDLFIVLRIGNGPKFVDPMVVDCCDEPTFYFVRTERLDRRKDEEQNNLLFVRSDSSLAQYSGKNIDFYIHLGDNMNVIHGEVYSAVITCYYTPTVMTKNARKS